MKPVIGIPLCHDAAGRIRPGRAVQYIDAAYAHAVAGAGGTPLHLPLHADPGELLPRIDGLLLPGGDDFAPERPYPDDVAFDLVAPEQLAFDTALAEGALARGLPVLGICYGMQLLARLHGGTLHAHLPLDLPEAAPHKLPEPGGRHDVIIEAGSRLARWLGAEATRVNSLHHQAVASPGRGLRAVAHAGDGVIEGVEADGDACVVGVQWHPEKLPGAECGGIFEAFVGACGETT